MTDQHQQSIREITLNLPLTREDIESLELGDVVFLNGLVFTGREGVYHRIFEKKIEPPIDISRLGGATFHCSPAICETTPGVYNVPSVTATASFRFAKYMPEFLKRYGIRVVIGKGGMSSEIYQGSLQTQRDRVSDHYRLRFGRHLRQGNPGCQRCSLERRARTGPGRMDS